MSCGGSFCRYNPYSQLPCSGAERIQAILYLSLPDMNSCFFSTVLTVRLLIPGSVAEPTGIKLLPPADFGESVLFPVYPLYPELPGLCQFYALRKISGIGRDGDAVPHQVGIKPVKTLNRGSGRTQSPGQPLPPAFPFRLPENPCLKKASRRFLFRYGADRLFSQKPPNDGRADGPDALHVGAHRGVSRGA